MHYLLDTNILIAMTKGHPDLLERLEVIPAGAIQLSSVVVAEIEYGIAKSTRQKQNRRVFDRLLNAFQMVPFDANAAQSYGPIRAQLEQRGQLIGPYDLMIAAHAKALDAVLITDNIGEFTRVDDLAVDNWLR